MPKPLLKIGASPILEIILKQLIDSGFRNFVISTHYKAQMLKDYFGDGSKWDGNISYVYEESPLGTAGSLGLTSLSSGIHTCSAGGSGTSCLASTTVQITID